jgi:hypothetical protein
MRHHLFTIAAAGFIGLGAIAGAARAEDVAAPGKATSPRQCVESIIAAAKGGDFEKMSSFLVEPWRTMMPKMMQATDTQGKADEHLKTAMEAKWPGSSADLHMRPSSKPKIMEGEVTIVDVKEEGPDKATVKTKETKKDGTTKEDDIHLVKEGDYWFANPPEGKGQQPPTPEMQKMMDTMSAAMMDTAKDIDALASDVEGGKVASKEDAEGRYRQIQMAFMQKMMQASGGAHPKGGPGGGPQGGGAGHH